MDTKKVLVIAYACEPNKTSEPGVGWHFSHEIAKFMDVTVLTRANNKQGIEAKKNTFGIKYIYFDLPEFYTRIKKHIPLGIQIYSKFWQWKAYTEVKKIIDKNEEKFDVIHHLTFGTTKNVPPVYRFDVPFIWGPIGGGDLIPYRFLKKMDLRSHITEFFYILIHAISKISPWSYLSRKKAKAIIFRTSSSANNFPKNGCKNRYLISETALPKTVSGRFNKKISDVLNTVCIGRIMHGKGYIYALQGFHNFLIAGGNGRLVFLGKGPEEDICRNE